MTKLFSAICLVICAALLLGSCSRIETLSDNISPDENAAYSFTSGETSPPGAYNQYKLAAQDFAFELLGNLPENEKGLCVSPSAVYSQLSLLRNAASGSTDAEIKKALGEMSLENLNLCNAYFFSRLDALSSEESFIRTDSELSFDEGIVVGQEFLIKNADYYNQKIYRGEKASGNIVAASTVGFEDEWLSGFTGEKDGTFAGKKATFLTGREYYLKAKGCTGFIKDFANTPLRFIAVLPDEGTDITGFLKSFDGEKYRELTGSMDIFTTCEAAVPQFSASGDLSLSDALSAVGIKEIFSGNAKLEGLSYGCKAKLGEFRQTCSYELKANGAKATAEKPEPKATVELNRPFVWILADNESMIPVMAGTAMRF